MKYKISVFPQEPNKRRTYVIIVTRTGEKLDYYRTKFAAHNDLAKWRNIVKEEVEVIENEKL